MTQALVDQDSQAERLAVDLAMTERMLVQAEMKVRAAEERAVKAQREAAGYKAAVDNLQAAIRDILQHVAHSDTYEMCPNVDAPDARDPMCPACRALMMANALVTRDGSRIRSALVELEDWAQEPGTSSMVADIARGEKALRAILAEVEGAEAL